MYEGIVQDLIDELGRLPGVGPKSAQRIAFHFLAAEPADVRRLAEVLLEVKAELEAGLMVTVNSDDPGYFGGYIGRNYEKTAEALGLSDAQLVTLARNSFTARFLHQRLILMFQERTVVLW